MVGTTSTRSKLAVQAAILVAVLAGYALRLYRLDYQSLWYDEAFSVLLARLDFSSILSLAAADNHPPLYFGILRLWGTVAGFSELSVRYLSLMAGLLSIPLAYALGHRLLGRRAELIASLLIAFSPVFVAYSQEARMYALATTFSLASVLALAAALQSGTRRNWAVFVVTTLLALYTHYYTTFVLAFQAVFAVGWLVLGRHAAKGDAASGPSQTQRFARPLLSVLVIAAGYLPWLIVPMTRFGANKTYYQGAMDFERVARETLALFAMGRTAPHDVWAPVSWLVALLAIAGWGIGGRSGAFSRRQVRLFLGLYLLLPVGLLVAVLTQRPKFGPQYLLIASPAFSLLVASAVATLSRGGASRKTLAMACCLAVLIADVLFLNNYYHDPAYARDDWRSVASFLKENRQPEDAVLLLAGYAGPALRYYYDRSDWQVVHETLVMNVDEVVDYDEASRLVADLADKRRVWLLLWQADMTDPNGLLPALLQEAGAQRVQVASYGTIALERYDLREGSVPLTPRTPRQVVDVYFGERFRLIGHDSFREKVASGEEIPLTLYWQALRAIEDDYNVVVLLRDRGGLEWGRVTKRPAADVYYTQRWKVGSVVPGDVSLVMLPGTPPGRYALQVGMFSATTMKPLDVLRAGTPIGTQATIGEVEVLSAKVPPSDEDLGLRSRVPQVVAPHVELLGALLSEAGVLAGQQVHLTTLWQAGASPRPDLLLEVLLLGEDERVVARHVGRPVGESYATDLWKEGERLRGQILLGVPAMAPGVVRLVGQTLAASDLTPVGEPFALADVRVLGRAHNTTERPALKVTLDAKLGTDVVLLGYDLDRASLTAGESLRLRLYWQALASPKESYKVFTHLLDEEQTIWAQEDAVPGRGSLPTSGWIPGEYIADEYVLATKTNAPPGEYRVEIGMYLERTGVRLPVTLCPTMPQTDHVVLPDTVRIAGR